MLRRDLPINSLGISNDRPLADAGWRRWFDILKEQGVDRIGGGMPMQQLAADSRRVEGRAPYAPAVNPLWTAASDADDLMSPAMMSLLGQQRKRR